jgi:Tfp pilus assembly protein PilV
MDLEMTTNPVRKPSAEAGFSMIEALIAAAILLILAIGMIPLFARSMINNALGNDYTQATAHGLTNLEKVWKEPINNVELNLTTGSSLQRSQYVRKALQSGSPVTDQDWSYTATSAVPVVWTRTTKVQIFPIGALADGQLTDSEALPAGTPQGSWALMRVTSLVDSGKLSASGVSSGLAAIRQTSFQFVKTN